MIKKTVPHTDILVIPIVWKKWFAIFRGINERDIEKEEYEDNPDYSPVSLKDVIDNLIFESRQSISGFPLDIYKMEKPEDALLILRTAAERIDAEYLAARPYIASFSKQTQDRFSNIHKECKVVCQIIDCYFREVSKGIVKDTEYVTCEDGQMICVIPDYFDMKRIMKLHSVVNGYCIEQLSIDTFVELLNSDDTLWDRHFSAYEGTSSKISPVADHELSFYTLLVVLMLGRNRYPDEYSFMRNCIDADAYEIDTRWVKKCTHLIKWQVPTEDESEFSWVDKVRTAEWNIDYWDANTLKYVCYERPSDPKGISDTDRTELRALLGRPVFDEICTNESLVKHAFRIYECDARHIQLCLAKVSENRKEHFCYWLKLLVNETNYFLLSKDAFCNQFISKDFYQKDIETDEFLQTVYTDLLDDLNSYFDGKDLDRYTRLALGDTFNPVIHILDQLDSFTHFVRLSEKPEVHQEIIGQIIDSCIDSDLEAKRILREAIEEESLIEAAPTVTPTDSAASDSTQGNVPNHSCISFSEDKEINKMCNNLYEKHLIDQNKNIQVSKARFARYLVEQRYIKIDTNLYTLFYKDYTRYSNGFTSLKTDEIIELSGRLIWKPLNNIFFYEGVTMSERDLKKAFSDGDSNGYKRNLVFFHIFQRLKPKA